MKREQAEALKREQDIKDWEEHQRGGGYKNRAPAKVDKEREALEQQAFPAWEQPSPFHHLLQLQ